MLGMHVMLGAMCLSLDNVESEETEGSIKMLLAEERRNRSEGTMFAIVQTEWRWTG